MNRSLYDKVVKYNIQAECREPLYIGSGTPFIQATGIAGAFRDYFSHDTDLLTELFGAREDEVMSGSKVCFTDGYFNKATVYTELRPRVRIDRRTGTSQTNSINGGAQESGQKFDIEIVAAGSTFSFDIYLFEKDKSYQAQLEKSLTALHNGNIQLGGQKSNGCGYIMLKSVDKSIYDMRNASDRNMWHDESKTAKNITATITHDTNAVDTRLHYILSGRTEGSILVKSVFVKNYDDNAPDAENIRNHKKQYIIPASSIKGVIRSQIEKICQYKGMDKSVIDNIFGKISDSSGEDGILGCVRFYDCVIGDIESNDKVPPQYRIHIDKFTGGVKYQGLFAEKPAGGALEIKVDIIDNHKQATDKAKALVLLALRDIGIGVVPLGGGSSIGRGYIEGYQLRVTKGTDTLTELDFKSGNCLTALQR
jgi:CRISPR/Cas system CSM-associated protein Csm3 (group 7 of RAMP superfamily)